MSSHLDNWEKNAIMVETKGVHQLDLKQTRLPCPWCAKTHLVITDKSASASGHMLCSNCGQFFKWEVNLTEGETKRSRPTRHKRAKKAPSGAA